MYKIIISYIMIHSIFYLYFVNFDLRTTIKGLICFAFYLLLLLCTRNLLHNIFNCVVYYSYSHNVLLCESNVILMGLSSLSCHSVIWVNEVIYEAVTRLALWCPFCAHFVQNRCMRPQVIFCESMVVGTKHAKKRRNCNLFQAGGLL